jgi:acyl carrier protein
MSLDPPLPGDVMEVVRSTVAEVLMIPLESVRDDAALMRDLGAESIDLLDLLFRLEEALGEKVPVQRWEEFLRRRLAGTDAAAGITPEVVVAFVEEQRKRQTS